LFLHPLFRQLSFRFAVNNSNSQVPPITWFDLTKKFYALKEKRFIVLSRNVLGNFATSGRCMTRTTSISNKKDYLVLRPIKDYRFFLKTLGTCGSDIRAHGGTSNPHSQFQDTRSFDAIIVKHTRASRPTSVIVFPRQSVIFGPQTRTKLAITDDQRRWRNSSSLVREGELSLRVTPDRKVQEMSNM